MGRVMHRYSSSDSELIPARSRTRKSDPGWEEASDWGNLVWPAWVMDGACRASTVDFSDHSRFARSAQVAVCRPCPVRDECAEFALELEGPNLNRRYGVFGGMGPTDRSNWWAAALGMTA